MTLSGYACDIQVEIAFNAGVNTDPALRTWTDVSDYVELADGIDITGGRADERSVADANSLGLVVDNSDGRFTPDLASGAYYPNVKIGRPIRVRATYPPAPSQNLLSAANAGFESGVGGWVASGTVAPTLASDATTFHTGPGSGNGAKSLKVTWNGSGSFPQAQVSTTGLTASVTYTAGVWVYVPTGAPDVRLVGSSSQTALSSVKDTWHRLTLTFTQGASTTVTIGIRSTGTPAATVCYVDDAMLVYGSEIGDYNTAATVTSTRFLGFVDEWPTDWPDEVDSYAASRIVASSRTARLGAAKPLLSLVEHEILARSPVAYYTMGEPAGATQALDSSGLGADPLVSWGTGTAVVFGNATGVGTDGLTAATVAAGGKSLRDSDSKTLTVGATVAFFVNTTSFSTIIQAKGMTIDLAAGIDLSSNNLTGGPANAGMSISDGATHHVGMVWDKSANLVRIYIDGVFKASAATTGNLTTGAVTIFGTSAAGFTMSHLALYETVLTAGDLLAISDAGLTGGASETAAARLTRLAGYAAIPAAEQSYDAAATTPIAFFDPSGGTALDAMRKVETTDGGVLYDSRDGVNTYQALDSRYVAASAVSLSFLSGELGTPTPRYDRQGLVNDATATFTGGTVSAKDQTSIDDYGSAAASLELATDDANEATSAAWWQVNVYSEPKTRVPSLEVADLTQLDPSKVNTVLGLDVGDVFTTTSWPSQAAASSQAFFVEGYSEVIGLESHVIGFNLSPAGIWTDVFVLEDATKGVIDSVYKIAR